ncbi:SDR family oxidoreductase [Paenibacillus sp. HN-1]|uniref:SDR family NAD(P)-dependent oxidoreductase n=1 Tax=Paenibacillus TaxID=44249 RepID=UPI001CA7EBE0|nr:MULTISPECIES: glucose 1-dehydrogenase [Paenibacillus]MBY9082101.1 SDR family oxidoreductase [Paenibacillus sp. CGMCC 1.18879]MBY9085741.1 SDR family oxidoreductase [Paenibacillus sinensis]
MYLPSFNLQGKKVLVTGAGKGIGRALAVGLAEAGCDVALLSRTQSDLEETAALIAEHTSSRSFCYPADVTSREQLEDAITRASADLGGLDLLVNNAGMNIRTPAIDVTDEEWETIMSTNLKSAFMGSQIAARIMKEQGGGSIINISSVGGHTALRTGVVYGSTKAAMIQMTKNLALEWAQYGIRVNAVGPWYFRTPLTEKLLNDEAYLKRITDRTPMGRVGSLEELVGPVVFLASEASNYMTGQTLLVDGGLSIFGF